MNLLRFLKRKRETVKPDFDSHRFQNSLDQYVSKMPSAQNAVDAVPGWSHAFPAETGVTAGGAHLYRDDRIAWCLQQAGSIEGLAVLELGPLEGMHTYMLAKAGAGHIDAIEANTLAYMRCLVGKEILRTPNTYFRLGDFVKWLEETDKQYDLVVASGVLYHSHDPIHLLDLISRRANAFYIWTHYYDDLLKSDLRGTPFSGHSVTRNFGEHGFDLYERSYYKAWNDPKFCGGPLDRHFWMKRDDILRLIELLGFSSITAHDMPDHVNGPCLSIFARRRC